MDVYLIVVDDHQEGMEYHVCATLAAANKLFQKIVKENYFYPEEDTKDDFGESCEQWFWDPVRGCCHMFKVHALKEDEI